MKNNLKRGIAPLIIILIIAALAGVGGVTYVVNKGGATLPSFLGGETALESLDNLQIETADFDVSTSPLPKLELSSMNIDVPDLSGPDLGSVSSSFSVDIPIKETSISIDSPDLTNIAPSISIPSIPAGINLPTDIGDLLIDDDTPPQGSGAPAIDCSMFNAVPSCSYVPAGQAQEACRSCFPNK